MIRSAFLRRMALAAAACAFIDVPWPKQEPRVWVAKNVIFTVYGEPVGVAYMAPGLLTLEQMRDLAPRS